jgi:GLPGLI family protein
MSKIFGITIGVLFLLISGINAQEILSGEHGSSRSEQDFSHVKVLDKNKLSCRYQQSIIRDTLNDRRQETLMLLEIGDKVSKYFAWNDSKDNPPEYSAEYKAVVDSLTKAKGGVAPRTSRRFRKNALFRNYPENKWTVIDYICLDFYSYEEDLTTPDWKLLKDTATISGYFCKKAITSFHGRDYEAWYAPEVPVSAGPWKFAGLPGLVFKVEDSNHYFSFVCVSIEKKDQTQTIYIDADDVKRITKKEFNRTLKAYYDDPKGFAEASSRVRIGVSSVPPIPYIPLELQ